MRKTIDMFGIPVDYITMEQAVQKVYTFLAEEKVHSIFTPNAEIMMAAQRDSFLRQILSEADMLVADGAGVVLASKILGRNVPEKVSGIDLVKNLFQNSKDGKIRYFLFGSKPGVGEIASERIVQAYPGVEIAGCRNGYFSEQEEVSIVEQINLSNADILLVALGAPKQEKWIYKYRKQLKVKVCIGVGGSLDVFAGTVKLAPEFMRQAGLEWLYRLYKQPWRWKRMLDLPKFMMLAVRERIGLK